MSHTTTATQLRLGLYVRLEAKPGQEAAVAEFLKSALPVVEREPATLTWYAMRMGPTTFGIYDTENQMAILISHDEYLALRETIEISGDADVRTLIDQAEEEVKRGAMLLPEDLFEG